MREILLHRHVEPHVLERPRQDQFQAAAESGAGPAEGAGVIFQDARGIDSDASTEEIDFEFSGVQAVGRRLAGFEDAGRSVRLWRRSGRRARLLTERFEMGQLER